MGFTRITTPFVFGLSLLLLSNCMFVIQIPLAEAQNGRPLTRTSTMPLNDCRTVAVDPRFARSQAMVERVFRRVAAASPEVFIGDLAPDRFCFRVLGGSSGGRASQLSLGVTIGPDLIDRIQNESQLAWLISHEIAHHTTRQTLDGNPLTGAAGVSVTQKMRRMQELQILMANGQKGVGNYFDLQRELERLNTEVRTAMKAALGDEPAANWDEAEADQVALRFYLRAGYDRTEIGWRTEQTVLALASGADPHSPPLAQTSIQREEATFRQCHLHRGARAPSRGLARYPSNCWSVWDLKFNQRAQSSDLQALYSGAPRIYLGAVDELRSAQAEVRASGCIGQPCLQPGATALPPGKGPAPSRPSAQ